MPHWNAPLAAGLVATAISFGLAAPASAQGQIETGQLICTSDGGIGLLIVSQKSFICGFKPTGTSPEQRYTATVTNFGLDLGLTGNTTLGWTALSTSNQIGDGMLAGTYGGAGVNASVGVGGGASVLVGGSNSTISLQPLSGQVQTGLNIAAGIRGLELRAATQP